MMTDESVFHHFAQCIQDSRDFRNRVSASIMDFGNYIFLIIIVLFFGYGGFLLC